MRTFGIEYDALKQKREARVRLLGWGTVALFLAIFVLVITLGAPGLVSVWTIFIPLFGASIGAGILVGRELRRRADREMVFLMDEDGITKRRQGFPDERINYTEIRSLQQLWGQLLVVSIRPYGSMTIPKAITRYETIRDELARRRPMAAHIKTKASPLRISVSLVAYSLCWVPILLWIASLIYKAIRG